MQSEQTKHKTTSAYLVSDSWPTLHCDHSRLSAAISAQVILLQLEQSPLLSKACPHFRDGQHGHPGVRYPPVQDLG